MAIIKLKPNYAQNTKNARTTLLRICDRILENLPSTQKLNSNVPKHLFSN